MPRREQLLGLDLKDVGDGEISRLLPNQPLIELITEVVRHKGAVQRSLELELIDEHDKQRQFAATARKLQSRERRGGQDSESRAEGDDAPAGVIVVLRDSVN